MKRYLFLISSVFVILVIVVISYYFIKFKPQNSLQVANKSETIKPYFSDFVSPYSDDDTKGLASDKVFLNNVTIKSKAKDILGFINITVEAETRELGKKEYLFKLLSSKKLLDGIPVDDFYKNIKDDSKTLYSVEIIMPRKADLGKYKQELCSNEIKCLADLDFMAEKNIEETRTLPEIFESIADKEVHVGSFAYVTSLVVN